jgi:hypothetical protein
VKLHDDEGEEEYNTGSDDAISDEDDERNIFDIIKYLHKN